MKYLAKRLFSLFRVEKIKFHRFWLPLEKSFASLEKTIIAHLG